MNFLKRQKKIIFWIGLGVIPGFASNDLFSEQQQNSSLFNSGTALIPSIFSGRLTCDVSIPGMESRKILEGTKTIQKKLQRKNPKPSSNNK